MVPLLGELTRPSARADRTRLRKLMESIGQVEIFEQAIVYSTPLFESNAMRQAGVALDGPWRIADMAVIENARPMSQPQSFALVEEWRDYRIGDDIISIRKLPFDSGRSRLAGTDGLSNVRTLDSVSRRHPPLLFEANLWSSRNRIATVDDLASAHRALALLSSSRPAPGSDSFFAALLRDEMLGGEAE